MSFKSAITFKLRKHKDLKMLGYKHSLIKDIISKEYNITYYDIYKTTFHNRLLLEGFRFTLETPYSDLKEIFF